MNSQNDVMHGSFGTPIFDNTVFSQMMVTKRNGAKVLFDSQKVYATINRVMGDLSSLVSVDLIVKEVIKNIYDGVTTQDLEKALVLSTIAFLEQDPAYGVVASRLLLQTVYKEVFKVSATDATLTALYQNAFITSIERGVENNILSPALLQFDLEFLAQHLHIERDHLFEYLGLQTLYDRYFLKVNRKKIELPQTFWMRIAMGLALQEKDKNKKAIEFYEMFSSLRYISSTPTLFHSGYVVPQLSSCYLTTVNDDLAHIFKCMGDNAQLSKWAGGIGNDWTNIRATGSMIKGIHATSQGVVPFLKIANDVVAGITRSGIRRGGTCAYLETWHLDIEDFLDLRRNTGDERRRTHDMNTANWIPDLFMKRVLADQDWTLFSPDETSDLHDLYGKAFEMRYEEYEQKAKSGQMIQFKSVSALKLWRKMLSRLFETGHPWITFKDPCNVRSPQDHAGVVHSSNLCTEITLNTSKDETAVCNLGSVNLSRHIIDGKLDEELLAQTVKTAVRMLDNVVDLNFYPTIEAKNSNLRHRPIGLGCMGFQDALFKLNIPFDSDEAIDFADATGEKILYYAVLGSSELACERGVYQSYKGSKWDRNIFPLDTINLLEQERGMPIEISRKSHLNWEPIRKHVKEWGMRNSNVLAIAPTATIANIAGCYPCIEPMYRNIYVKANIAGEFTIINNYLVNDLKALGLWNQSMLEQIKYYDGNLQMIDEIPDQLKRKYKGAFELDPVHMIKITAARGKWIDQSQSHNVFMQGVSGQKLHDIYTTAWRMGLKTLYYLRTLGASQIEKSTLDAKKWGYTQKREYKEGAVSSVQPETAPVGLNAAVSNEQSEVVAFNPAKAYACGIDNPECESCQ